MKRQSSTSNSEKIESSVKKAAKKKMKGAVAIGGATTEQVAEEEKRKKAEEETPAEAAVECGGLWSGVGAVDEEMPWATSWIPFWEVEATGDAYDALYGDVLWDYDIWDFKANELAPNP